MKKKIIVLNALSTSTFLPLVAVSCQSIRERRDKQTYIKSFNHANLIKDSFLVNKNKKITTDYEALVSTPLIRYAYSGEAKYDKLNKNYIKATSKYLEFVLAQSISITTKDLDTNGKNIVKIYSRDKVKKSKENSYFAGVVQVYSEEENNINSPSFFKDLKNAISVTFELKKNIYYSDIDGDITNDELKAQDFLTSLQLNEENKKATDYLYKSYGLNFDVNDFKDNKITFNLMDNWKTIKNNNLYLFVTKTLTNNLLFSPLPCDAVQKDPDYGKDMNQLLYLSPYILKKNALDKQIFIKNPNYVLGEFANNTESKINKIFFKYNPLSMDEATYRLQSFNSYRQNLISEATYDLFTKEQKEDIENNSYLYGLTYSVLNDSDINVSPYFYNLVPNVENSKAGFNDAFCKLFYGYSIDEFKNKKVLIDKYYDIERIELRTILNNVLNQFTLTKMLDHNNYWNSYASQNLTFDAINADDVKANKTADLISYINVIRDYSYDQKTNEFNKSLIYFDIVSDALSNEYFKNENITELQKQLRTAYYSKYQKRIKEILDKFYLENSNFKNEKISWIIPVYSVISKNIDNYYSNITRYINNLDSRLNVSYKYVDKNSQNFYSNYYSCTLVNNSFSNHLLALINNDKASLIWNLLGAKNNASFKLLPYSNNIEKIIGIFESATKKDVLKNFDYSQLYGSNPFLKLLELNNIKIENFEFNFKTKIQEMSVDEQMKMLKDLDDFLNFRSNENTFLFTNEYSKILVQYFYIKPLNDQGFTYYQDIDVS